MTIIPGAGVTDESEQERNGEGDKAGAAIGSLRRGLQDLRENPIVARLIDCDEQIPSDAEIERMAARVRAMRSPRTPR